MQIIPPAVSNIDMQLAELGGIVDALILLQEEADAGERVRNSTIALLYVAGDKVRNALASSASLHRIETAH